MLFFFTLHQYPESEDWRCKSRPYFSDEKVQYIVLDKHIKTKDLTTQSNQLKPISECFKKPVKQVLRYRIKKKYNYIAIKNVRFSNWEPIRKTFMQILILSLTLTLNSFWKVLIPDAEASKLRKTVERKKHL